MDEDLKALHETLKSAAESNSTAHIRPNEAKRGADSIERVQQAVDEAFDKYAQRNMAENKE